MDYNDVKARIIHETEASLDSNRDSRFIKGKIIGMLKVYKELGILSEGDRGDLYDYILDNYF